MVLRTYAVELGRQNFIQAQFFLIWSQQNSEEPSNRAIGSIQTSFLTISYSRVCTLSGSPMEHNYGKSPFSMGKSTINGHFQ